MSALLRDVLHHWSLNQTGSELMPTLCLPYSLTVPAHGLHRKVGLQGRPTVREILG